VKGADNGYNNLTESTRRYPTLCGSVLLFPRIIPPVDRIHGDRTASRHASPSGCNDLPRRSLSLAKNSTILEISHTDLDSRLRRRRCALNTDFLKDNFTKISLLAVILLVALRITIGWHFFYEGVWKIKHADEFSAAPFLTQAKGPFAPLFYSMIDDINGERRLKVEKDADGEVVTATDKETGDVYPVIKGEEFSAAIADFRAKVDAKYGLDDKQKKLADAVGARFQHGLATWLQINGWDIVGYHDSLKRLAEANASGGDSTDTRKQRNWQWQMKLRGEVNGWIGELEDMDADYQRAIWSEVLTEEQRAMGEVSKSITFADFMDFAVTWSLTAIGLCLMLGFCSRLAALGGAAFLVSVLMTQPPWPTIYPPAPAVVGHALIVDKNFVEMMALLALATMPVGRWAGLDLFLYRYVGKPLMAACGCKCNCKCSEETAKAQ